MNNDCRTDGGEIAADTDDRASKRYRRELVCFKDTDSAEGVCGECGRPVCGPVLNATVGGLVGDLFNDHGHGRLFHDATFYHYESGVKKVILSVILVGVAALIGVVFPDFFPAVSSALFSRSIGLNDAVVQSSVILSVATLLTLRYQRGERNTSFRVRSRRTIDRLFCDQCFENRLVQLVVSYALSAVILVLVLLGLRGIVTQGSVRPLRLIALGAAVSILKTDVVAYAMAVLEPGDHDPVTDTTSGSRSNSDSNGIEVESDPDTGSGFADDSTVGSDVDAAPVSDREAAED